MSKEDEGEDAHTLLLKLAMARLMSQGKSRDEARQIAEQTLRLRTQYRNPLLDELEHCQFLDGTDEQEMEKPLNTPTETARLRRIVADGPGCPRYPAGSFEFAVTRLREIDDAEAGFVLADTEQGPATA